MTSSLQPDRAEIGRFVRLLHPEMGSVYEMRAFDRAGRTISGYFSSVDAFTDAAVRISGEARGVHVTLNAVDPTLLARRANRAAYVGRGESTTADRNVPRRTALLVDLDPERPEGVSSTDIEHAAAIAKAHETAAALRAQGWPEPALVDSGNGAHLVYPINEPGDDGELVKRVLLALAAAFDDGAVHVDTGVFNPARITKVPGTPVRKGDSTTDRPHRLARFLSAPDALQPVPHELLAELAAQVPADAPRERHGGGSSAPLDVERFLAAAGLETRGSPVTAAGGTRWRFAACPHCGGAPGATPGCGSTPAAASPLAAGATLATCHGRHCESGSLMPTSR